MDIEKLTDAELTVLWRLLSRLYHTEDDCPETALDLRRYVSDVGMFRGFVVPQDAAPPSLRRMWINQPSTLQPYYYLHGTRVLAIRESATIERVYFLSGPVSDQQMVATALAEGWQVE